MSAAAMSPGDAATGGATVLIVEDEAPLSQLVADYLERDGFSVHQAGDGVAGLEQAQRLAPDVVILDIGLPRLDGIEVCRRIRAFSDCYILMLTARSDEVDKLIGLSVGADDYLTKPFSPREIVARVKVLLRRPRTSAASGAVLRFGALEVDPVGREVRVDGAAVALTPTEFDLLATLAGQARVAFSRRQLVETVWGGNWVGDERLVDVHIRSLRHKLGDDAKAPRYIRTVRGHGYRMGSGR